jgi:hypothetical protein
MLLSQLQDWATQDQYVYRHKWKVGEGRPVDAEMDLQQYWRVPKSRLQSAALWKIEVSR